MSFSKVNNLPFFCQWADYTNSVKRLKACYLHDFTTCHFTSGTLVRPDNVALLCESWRNKNDAIFLLRDNFFYSFCESRLLSIMST